jgi:hypothetical protein
MLKRFATCIVAAVAFVAVPSAFAQSPVIYACVASSGSMRIVSATTTCKQNETPLNWNQRGVSGLNVVAGTLSCSAEELPTCERRVYCNPGDAVLSGNIIVEVPSGTPGRDLVTPASHPTWALPLEGIGSRLFYINVPNTFGTEFSIYYYVTCAKAS